MLYLCCQTVSPMPSVGSGNDRKFAFVMGGECESTPRYVAIPDGPRTKAFFVKIATMYKSDSCTISEVDSVLNKAREGEK